MRDLIWTIIVVWLVWKIYDTIATTSKAKKKSNFQDKKEGEIRIETTINQKSYFNPKDAEYVDYEEIK